MGRMRVNRMCREVDVVLRADGATLVRRCYRARGWRARLVGLLGTPDLEPDEGLWLERCRSVHTAGMRIVIACAFVDADGRVLRVVDPLPTWRTVSVRGADAVLETGAGRLAGLAVGEVLTRTPAPPMPG